MKKTLYLLDGQGLIYRAYHALPYLSTSKGLPTNAIYGYTSMLIRLVSDYSIDYAVAAFDLPIPTVRHKQYSAYKANRPPMPSDLSLQIPYIKEITSAFGITIKEMEGYEADDVIASLAMQAKAKSFEVFILSGDLDCLQIVGENIKLLIPRVGITDLREIDEKAVLERYGIPPAKIPDLKALAGDVSDNLPGIPGFGTKKAAQLLNRFSSIEEIYERIDELPPQLRETLLSYEEIVRRNKDLALLKVDLPLKIEDVPPFKPDWARLRKILQELEMKKLIERLPTEEGSLFIKEEPENKVQTQYVRATEDLLELLKKSPREISLYLGEGKLHIATREGEVFSLSLFTGRDLFGASENKIAILKPLLQDERVAKIGHDLKSMMLLLAREEDVHLQGIYFDTMLASYLLNPIRGGHRLEDVYRELFGEELSNEPSQRAVKLFSLKEKMEEKLREEGLEKVFSEIEMPLLPVLFDMELVGVKIDVELMKKLSMEVMERMREVEKEIYRIAGIEFNIASPKQLRQVLSERLKIPLGKKKKTGLSTDAEVLEELAPQYEIARKILEWRELSKCKGTYIDVLPRLADSRGRVHTSFNQCVTATGRLSSSEPNLQNIPVRGEWAKRLREAFICDEGYILISADYSQIELRILAHLSEDPALLEAFQKGEDIHSLTASSLFGVPLEEVTEELRRRGKTVNFGIVYGISEFGLAKELGISEESAREYIEQYFKKFPKVKEYIDRTVEEAREKGYVRTIFGRKRPLPELSSSNRMVREFGKRAAINAPVQGSAADLIKLAMIKIHRRLKREGLPARLLLQVHDELLIETRKDIREYVKEILKEEMENAYPLSVPLVVKIGEGENWGMITH
ncbi:MAG: DNA polymerase I [bacterium]